MRTSEQTPVIHPSSQAVYRANAFVLDIEPWSTAQVTVALHDSDHAGDITVARSVV